MALPENPISGGYTLSNSPWITYWTCPACYENHEDCSEGDVIECGCGATLMLSVEHQPVCIADCIDPEANS